jgi:hypothetical protein
VFWVGLGCPAPFRKPQRRTVFDGLEDWLRERFFRRAGNAVVIWQELESEHGIVIGLRSVELRVRCWRRELKARTLATTRFETAPGSSCRSTSATRGCGSAASACGCTVSPYVRGSGGGSPYTVPSRVARMGRADPHRRRASRGAV